LHRLKLKVIIVVGSVDLNMKKDGKGMGRERKKKRGI